MQDNRCGGKKIMGYLRLEKIILAIVFLWVFIRLVLLIAEYRGNNCSVVKENIQKYFTEHDLERGKEFAHYGFFFKALYGFANIFLLLWLIKSGALSSAYVFISNLFPSKLLVVDIIYLLAFYTFLRLLSLPTAYVLGFMREEAMGFSNISSFEWLSLFTRVSLVNIFVYSLASTLILIVINKLPDWWPYVLPAVLGIGAFVMVVVYPLIITPLFYNLRPMPDSNLKRDLLQLSADAGMNITQVYIIDASRYTARVNAYFTGFGRFRRIVLFDNLINKHTPEEVKLIFAHEAGHWKYSHVTWGIMLSVLGAYVGSLLIYIIYPGLTTINWLHLPEKLNALSLSFFYVSFVAVSLIVVSPIESQISQFMERQADQFALDVTGLKDEYIQTQVNLARNNRTNLMPHPLRVFWLHSHPTTIDRILMATKAQQKK